MKVFEMLREKGPEALGKRVEASGELVDYGYCDLKPWMNSNLKVGNWDSQNESTDFVKRTRLKIHQG